MTSFVLRTVLPAARTVIERAERLALSERDRLKVLDLLENPSAPNARLRAAARGGNVTDVWLSPLEALKGKG